MAVTVCVLRNVSDHPPELRLRGFFSGEIEKTTQLKLRGF